MLRYAITDGRQQPGSGAWPDDTLAARINVLRRLQVDYVQVREKDLPFAEAAALAARLQAAILQTGGTTQVLLNTAIDAASLQAWPEGIGVHLSARTISAWTGEIARGAAAPSTLVSASCHAVEEAELAGRVATLLLFAPVFEKRVHGELIREGTGLKALAEVCRAVAPLPVLAMGGVHWANASACVAAGAAGVAGIRLFQQDSTPA